MSLDDLNKQLYSQDSQDLANRVHEQSEYDPQTAGLNKSPFEQDQQWHQVQKGLSPKGKRNLWIAITFFSLVILGIAGTYFYQWWQKDAFHQDRVFVSFDGPKEADSTQPTKFLIHYKNDNRVTLKNAELNLSYSENFQPTDNLNLKYLNQTSSKIYVGDIPAKSESTIELKGIFYAPKDFPVYLHGKLAFTPSNGSNQLSIESQTGVKITSAPIFLDVVGPQKAVDGDTITYIIDYKNLDVRQMGGLQLRATFPSGFQMISAEPKPSEQNSFWYIGNLESNASGKITIQGQLNGTDGDNKDLSVSIGSLSDAGSFVVFGKQELSTQIVTPVLTIKQRLDGNVDGVIKPGDVLKYVISFKNIGTVGLHDAIINAKVDGKILDFSKLAVEKGAFDGKTGVISWKASDVPALANIDPQASGEVYFSIPVLERIPIDDKSDKNFIVTSRATIDSPDIPTPIDSNKIIGSNKLVLNLASKVLFETKGFFNDDHVKNSGIIPMQVGTETTFAIHWSISSISNDLGDVKVAGSLPTGVRWTGQVYPSDEKIIYNQRTNELVWNVGNVAAGSGALLPKKEVIFQVAVTPQINQVGMPINLVGKSTFTGTDLFINKSITLENAAKDTQLYEDPLIGVNNGKVAK